MYGERLRRIKIAQTFNLRLLGSPQTTIPIGKPAHAAHALIGIVIARLCSEVVIQKAIELYHH